ncbi:hypothetical protein BDR07DRAFT_677782 [Suillus spraguei]|nr:hypothetical protein BDR07DRAFT_677782 [Suillus spraguei]
MHRLKSVINFLVVIQVKMPRDVLILFTSSIDMFACMIGPSYQADMESLCIDSTKTCTVPLPRYKVPMHSRSRLFTPTQQTSIDMQLSYLTILACSIFMGVRASASPPSETSTCTRNGNLEVCTEDWDCCSGCCASYVCLPC